MSYNVVQLLKKKNPVFTMPADDESVKGSWQDTVYKTQETL